MVITLSFIAYSLIILGVGLWAALRPQVTASDVHLGGREHGTWTSSLSASASTESGFVLLGMVGAGFQTGISALWIVPAGVLGYLLLWVILAPELRERSERLNAVTVPELISRSTKDKFSNLAAALAGVLGIIFLLAYVAAQFSAAGKAISSQFEFSYVTATGIAAVFVVTYAMLGGFRAVSWSDTIQAVMMCFALVVLPLVVVGSIGGFESMASNLSSIDPTLLSLTGGASSVSGAAMVILPWLMLGLAYPGQPHAVARLMAVKDKKVFRWAPVIAITWFILVYSGAVLLGMAARAGFAEMQQIASDPENILPVLAVEFLPETLAGITLAAVIAAITSTADSTLLASATTVVRDLRKALRLPEPKSELWWTRGVLLVLAIVAALFAFQETPVVFEIVLVAWSGLGASLGPTVLYCTLVRTPKGAAALAGLIVGGGLAFLLQDFQIDLLLGFTASSAAIVATHFISIRRDTEEAVPST